MTFAYEKIKAQDVKVGDKIKYSNRHYHKPFEVTAMEVTRTGKSIKFNDGHEAVLRKWTFVYRLKEES